MNIHVRPARTDDAAMAIETLRASIELLCQADHRGDPATLSAWLANKTPENFCSWQSDPNNFCVVAESRGVLVGIGLVHRAGEIRLLYLAPGQQGRGIGLSIYQALEVKAREWAIGRLTLDSTALARRFYESVGFSPAGPAAPAFGMITAYPYEKQLQPNISLKRTNQSLRD